MPQQAQQVQHEHDGRATLARVYNKFVVDMAMNLKPLSPTLKSALKERYRAIEIEKHDYVEHAAPRVPRDALLETEPDALLDNATIAAFEPLPGVSVGSFAGELPPAARTLLRSYVYIFGVLCVTYAECADGAPDTHALVRNVLDVLARAQHGGEPGEALDAILDDDIAGLLQRVREEAAAAAALADAAGDGQEKGAPASAGDGPDVEALERALEGSKIADLAREIASEVDVSHLPADGNPADMLNFANIADPNSMLGSIVSKVGTKIQSKLASGEMRHEDLMGEALGLLRAFDGGARGGGGGGGGGGGVADILKAFGGTGGDGVGMPSLASLANLASGLMGGGGVGASSPSPDAMRSAQARDRLRAKLDAKHKASRTGNRHA